MKKLKKKIIFSNNLFIKKFTKLNLLLGHSIYNFPPISQQQIETKSTVFVILFFFKWEALFCFDFLENEIIGFDENLAVVSDMPRHVIKMPAYPKSCIKNV